MSWKIHLLPDKPESVLSNLHKMTYMKPQKQSQTQPIYDILTPKSNPSHITGRLMLRFLHAIPAYLRYKMQYEHSAWSTWCPDQRGSFVIWSSPSNSITNRLLTRFRCRHLELSSRLRTVIDMHILCLLYVGLSLTISISINSCKLFITYIFFANGVKQS